MAQTKIMIDGMSCIHCVGKVQSALEAVPGVTIARVDVGSATVDYDEAQAGDEALRAAIEKAGYKVIN